MMEFTAKITEQLGSVEFARQLTLQWERQQLPSYIVNFAVNYIGTNSIVIFAENFFEKE